MTMAGVDAIEAAGLDGLWARDHFMLGPHKQEYEVWTLLGALAERTNLEIGPLLGSITYRNPALLAKMATTVDHLSDGRLQLGLGAGWHDEEHTAYDFTFPPADQRMEMLDEGLELLKTMFTEDAPTYEGDHYRIADAYNEPKPVQDPHPPIVVVVAGPQLLRIAAFHADEWNIEISSRAPGLTIEFQAKKFDEYLEEEGRNPDDVKRLWLAHILVKKDQETVDEYCDEIFPLP